MTQKLAAVVCALKDERGLSGRELGRRTGMGSTALAYKLAGTRPFSVPDLERLGREFGLKPSELLARAEGD